MSRVTRSLAMLAALFSLAGEAETDRLERATFAGGCFWCMEHPFEEMVGVKNAISGYAGGTTPNPTYEEVSAGKGGHLEVIQVIYDPRLISYERLLEIFWMNVNPTDSGGQFVDRGPQYATAIFYHDQRQKELAHQSIVQLETQQIFSQKIVTPIRELKAFYPAEEYHQDYYKKNLITKAKYHYYRSRSGRDDFLEKIWSDRYFSFQRKGRSYQLPDIGKLKEKLTPLQYQVTREQGTEPPFKNQYWNNKREGIYVDIVSGEPLFSSKDKYDSGSGWPSFTKPIDPHLVLERQDGSLGMERIEAYSRHGRSHLGHIFRDGPAPTGLRFCINSAALRFIPKEELKGSPYQNYLELFN